MTQMWDNRQGISTPPPNKSGWTWIPMVRLANILSARFLPGSSQGAGQQVTPSKHDIIMSDDGVSDEQTRSMTEYVVSRYLDNLRMIRAVCEEYRIQPCFVWQPSPGYKYDRTLHKKFPFEGPVPKYWQKVYTRMEGYKSSDFLYLGDMLQDVREKVFVDDVHYNEVLNEKIASRICERLDLDNEKTRVLASSNQPNDPKGPAN
jgi:hypothetical protein